MICYNHRARVLLLRADSYSVPQAMGESIGEQEHF